MGEPLRIGGKLDTLTRRFVGPCDTYRVWFVGEKQREFIEAFLVGKVSRNTLLFSAEGAGKTVLSAMLGLIIIIMATESGITGALGATAPTHPRLGTLIAAFRDLVPVASAREGMSGAWGTYHTDSSDLTMASGHVIQFRSTKQQSEAAGPPIQGWNWGLGVVCDEIQDSTHAWNDILSRLRAGKEPRVVATATAKDSSAFRTWRNNLSSAWEVKRLSYLETPFVHDEHWKTMQAELSMREWKRRGLAMDTPPERAIYNFERSRNLIRVPENAIDVTKEVLAPWGSNYRLLAGHDPGKMWDVTVLLKCYRMLGHNRNIWVVVDVINTKRTTTEQHRDTVLSFVRNKYHCNELDFRGKPSEFGNRFLVRADPYANSANDSSQPHKSVYTIWRNAGVKILPASTRAVADRVITQKIPIEARIEMICSLLENSQGESRLMVAMDDRGRPCDEKILEAFEMSERNEMGEAEKDRKDSKDLSHWMAAIGYALWEIERPRYREAVA